MNSNLFGRREFLAAALTPCQSRVILPVHCIPDRWAKCPPALVAYFEGSVWPEAVRDFRRCGVELQRSDGTGEVQRAASGKPIFTGLRRGAINVVLTRRVPMHWDRGRGLAGVAVNYEGSAVCLLALEYAHCHQVPFLSVNTCVHELLHAVMGDLRQARPTGLEGEARELRIDAIATELWLFREGTAIRQAVERGPFCPCCTRSPT